MQLRSDRGKQIIIMMQARARGLKADLPYNCRQFTRTSKDETAEMAKQETVEAASRP